MPDDRPGREEWLARHPYLEAVARLQREVEAVLAGLPRPDAAIPDWSDYAGEYQDGVPVLAASRIAVDLEPARAVIVSLVEALASGRLSGKAATDVSLLRDALCRDGAGSTSVMVWLQGDDTSAPAPQGLLRYLGWTAAAACLAPVLRAFEAWRDDERWMRRYCPMCGSSPTMGQLVGVDPGRLRLLSCGRCGDRWRYRRTDCPFCETDSHTLSSVVLDGEAGLRIDWCDLCKGYLKTYDGQGNEDLLLSDWSSLHLDVIALDRGWVRAGTSLYSFAPRLGESTSA